MCNKLLNDPQISSFYKAIAYFYIGTCALKENRDLTALKFYRATVKTYEDNKDEMLKKMQNNSPFSKVLDLQELKLHIAKLEVIVQPDQDTFENALITSETM